MINSSVIASNEVIKVLRRTLGNIDERLVDHGDRVAYIASEICKRSPEGLDPQKLFILSELHDVGAYKTDEIDNMVVFETSKPLQHSVYGYLFLKSIDTMKDSAEAILYHHSAYSEIKDIDSVYIKYAEIIYLSDRIDILALSGDDSTLSVLKELSGTRFCPEYVNAFFEANKDGSISAAVRGDGYRIFSDKMNNSLTLSEDEAMDYLRLLVYAIDFRSEHTVAHTVYTTAISDTLAKLIDVPETEREIIHFGAFFHDLGKISTPVSILESTGKLTPQEMDIMRKHVEGTEHILSGIVSDDIFQIAVRHHEKLNGKGYPHGLNSKDLSLSQRIVAVADVLSALSGKRSYKDPFPKTKIVEIITSMVNNGELCPRVCSCVMKNYDYIMAEAEKAFNPVKDMYENMKTELVKLEYTL